MKKIILFIPTLNTAGAEKFVVDLALNIDVGNYGLTVAVTKTYLNTEFSSVLLKNNINVVGFNEKNIIKKMLKILKFINETRPDVVHANLGSLLYIMFQVAFCRVKTRIFTFHSVADRAAGKSRIKKMFYSFAFKKLGFIPVGICDYVKKSISNEYRIPLNQIPCIYNGVDTKLFAPHVIRKNNDININFITTGTLYYIKNHKLLITAFNKVERLYPNVTLTILGDGELREELQQMINIDGLEDKVTILGCVRNVADYLHRADIYVMSSDVEGLPLSVLEAMACGLPVITTAAGGVVDIVKDGCNGIVVPVGDVNLLFRAMCELIENIDARKLMGINSRKMALELDIHKCVEKYEQLYKEGKSIPFMY